MKKTQIAVIALLAILTLSLTSIPTVFAEYVTSHDDEVYIAPYDWLYWNSSSDSAAIILYGGWGYSDCVVPWPLNYSGQYTVDKMFFIDQLHAYGLDILTPNDFVYYYNTSTWLADAAEWLRNASYTNVYLFGWSAGGVATGYEIQKPGADELYNASVIVAAPVNWTGKEGCDLYFTAQKADETLVRTSFICCENDTVTEPPVYDQMKLYYYNMNSSLAKAWHDWEEGDNGAHDPFPDTCVTHSSENMSQAVWGWFSSETHDITFECINYQYQFLEARPVVIDDEYFVWSNETVTVYPGWHTFEMPAAWQGEGFTHWLYPYTPNPTIFGWVQDDWEFWAAYWGSANTNYTFHLNALDPETYTFYDVPITVDGEDVLYTSGAYSMYEGWHTLEAPEVWDEYLHFEYWWNDASFYSYNNTILIDVQATYWATAIYDPHYYDLTILTLGYAYAPLEMPVIIDDEYFVWTNDTYELPEGWHTLEVAPAWNGSDFNDWWYPYSASTTLSINLQSDTECCAMYWDSATDTYNLTLVAINQFMATGTVPVTVDNSSTLYSNDTYELYEGWHTLEVPTEVENHVFYEWDDYPYFYSYNATILMDLEANDEFWACYWYTG